MKQERKGQKTDMLRDSLSDIGKKGGPKILVYRTYVTHIMQAYRHTVSRLEQTDETE